VKEMAQLLIEHISSFAGDYLISLIIITFFASVILRALIYFTVTRHEWFAKEFEKRVDQYVEVANKTSAPLSFYIIAKKLLEKTYYENFEMRSKLRRRKPDRVMDLSDRIFLIKQGSAWIVKDCLKQLKHLKYSYQQPKILNVTKSVFKSNPCFNNVLGIFPMGTVNNVLNILPGLFVIGGIFGTFLGIMKGLPGLSGMNLSDTEQTKLVMDQFLGNIAFSMTTSIVGIMCSVGMSMFNTVFSPEQLFVGLIDRFENSLDILWNLSSNNDLPEAGIEFDENRDSTEAIAEASLHQELDKKHRTRDMDKLNKPRKIS
jgi:hypothetical protein